MTDSRDRITSQNRAVCLQRLMMCLGALSLGCSGVSAQCITNSNLITAQSTIESAAAFDGDIVVGGMFSSLRGVAVDNIGSYSSGQVTPLGSGLDARCNVLEVNTVGDTLFAAGWFNLAGGQVAHHIAAWSGTAWSSLGTGANNGVSSGTIHALKSIGADLFVGGNFAAAGTATSVGGVARWDGAAWNRLGTAGTDGVVYALAEFEGAVIVAGNFGHAGGVVATNIARFEETVWSPLGSLPPVQSLAVCNGELFAACDNVDSIWRWSGTMWVDDRYASQPQRVERLYCDGQRLFAATVFNELWTRLENGIWVPVMDFGPVDLDQNIGHMGGFATQNDRLFVASWRDDTFDEFGPFGRLDRVRILGGGAPTIGQQPIDTHADLYGPLSLTVAPGSGTGSVGYQWYKDGAPLLGETASTLDRAHTTLDDAGDYFVELLNPCGVTPSAIATVTLRVPCLGDVDENLRVDLTDLARLLSSYGLCAGTPGFDAAADLNFTSCVDLVDLSTLLTVFGSDCP